MTSTTHQLIGLLAGLLIAIHWSWTFTPVAAVLAFIGVVMGSLLPDLDQPTAHLWQRIVGGRLVGSVVSAAAGGHRHITHSLLGLVLVGWGVRWLLLHLIQPHVYPLAHVFWLGLMIGYSAHLAADTITDHGVPWLWPLSFAIRIPPGPNAFRVTSGSFVELFIVRGATTLAILLILVKYGRILIR